MNEDNAEVTAARSSIKDDGESCNNKNTMIKINTLLPEKLITLDMTLYEKNLKALIDTGANRSLVRSSCVSKDCVLDRSRKESIRGFNDHRIETLGTVNLVLSWYNIDMPLKFHVVQDDAIDYEVMLGLDFLHKHRINIDVSRNKVSIVNNDESFSDFYLDVDNNVKQIIHERVPIYCARNTYLTNNKMVQVPIRINFACDKNSMHELLYLEGEEKNENFETMCGVLEINDDNEPQVLMRNRKENRKTLIRENKIIGRISTVITVDEEDDDNKPEEWTMDRIKENIKLGEILSPVEREVAYKMLFSTVGVLSKGDSDVGLAKTMPHTIELTNYTPIWQRPRTFSEPVNKEIEEQCHELLSLDIIEQSNSKWSSPIVPVRKPSGELRLCIDYRKVNQVTKTSHFPMPNLNHYIYKAQHINYMTKLDLVRGYYQIPLEKESREYTAFSTPQNHYQFKRLSFGLKNSGIAFQQVMQQLMSPIDSKRIIVYIDDILIMSTTFDEHVQLVRRVLATLCKNGIKIKVPKCEFFRKQVQFLGHIISERGIAKCPKYIEQVKEFPVPTTVTQVRQFLGLVTFQRKFIRNCSIIAQPLSKLTSGPKKKKLTLNEEEVAAFEKLKDEMAKDLYLAYPDYSPNAEKLEVWTDASGTGVGACIVQPQNGEYRTISFASMCFNPAQKKYSATERELTGIRWAVKIFKHFIYGTQFLIYTDHKPLIYLQNMALNSSRLARTMEDLAEYDFEVRYRPGIENSSADFLSRLYAEDSEIRELETDYKKLPKGLKVVKTVEGGGDSLFESLLICMRELNDIATPATAEELREVLINELLNEPAKYNLKINKTLRNSLKLGKIPGQFPPEEVILAAANKYDINIYVHHGTRHPVLYKISDKPKDTIHLQCISLIHYNPLYETKMYKEDSDRKLAINTVNQETEVNIQVSNGEKEREDYIEHLTEENNEIVEFNVLECKPRCQHNCRGPVKTIVRYNDKEYCAILDTGAQVSLMSEDVYNQLMDEGVRIRLKESDKILYGIGNRPTDIIGVGYIKFVFFGNIESQDIPFAIVNKTSLPCCLLLGLNFIKLNKINIDCSRGVVHTEKNNKIYFQKIFIPQERLQCEFYGTVVTEIESASENEEDKSENTDNEEEKEHTDNEEEREEQTDNEEGREEQTDDEEEKEEYTDDEDFHIKINIDQNDLHVMQDRQIIKSLKNKIWNGIHPKFWNDVKLQQFKRYYKELKFRGRLLVRTNLNGTVAVVVTFSFLVDIVFKIHASAAHVGKHKMLELIRGKFFHPALPKVVNDVCRSCHHCQIYKTNPVRVKPPIIKIKTERPFQLIAIDILLFPKSSSGNIGILVVVDLFSKWLSAVPIRNKKAETVTKAFKLQVLPMLPKIPEKILSDNGSEFKNTKFEELLNEYNIIHTFSTPFKPSSNGGVERVNQTVISLLKGTITNGAELGRVDWDEKLPKVVITYNNTIHSQTGMSPTTCIMTKAHDLETNCLLDANISSKWIEGNPNFAPFELGQLVLKAIERKGKLLVDKLKPKYDGPFKITKVQSNKVTYEIKRINSNMTECRAHYQQLRPYKEIPNYLRKFILSDDASVGELDFFQESDELASQQQSDDDEDGNISNSENEMNVSRVNQGELLKRNNYTKLIFRKYPVVKNEQRDTLNSTLNSKSMDSKGDKDVISETMFSYIEQSLTAQELLIDELVEMNESEHTLSSYDIANVFCETEQHPSEQSGSTALGECSDNLATKRSNLISEIKLITSRNREILANNRVLALERRNSLESFRNSFSLINTSITNASHFVTSEVADYLPNLPVTSSPRILRSRGQVDELPHVQKRTLEYKRRVINK